jgi:spermidine/putrescine transport system substrate-binding protein
MNIGRALLYGVCISSALVAIYLFLHIPTFIDYFRTQKSINVLAWPSVMDAEYFQEFEKKTGIKVYLTYFDSYEELVVKLRAGGGDYDLVMAADYVVNILKEEGLVKKIDRQKIDFWQSLYKPLLGLYYDRLNEYTIPFAWEIYGIGINTDYFKDAMPPATWGLLFDPAIAPARLGMLDDAREVVSIAALYLFGKKKKNDITDDELEKVKQLLLAQKKLVAMYTDLRTDYLLASGTVPVVLGISSNIYNAMRQRKNIQFLLPKEGSFLVIDVMLLPHTTQKENLVYEFLNYLYKPEILQKYADRYNFFPVRDGVTSCENRFFLTPAQSLFSSLRFFNYAISEQQLRDLWITLKS